MRLSKMSREVSNFIVARVLERSDDLIKNSYRRLTTENVARNEHWANIAEIVSEHFDVPADMERVKSHFHNRKKVLVARMKEELKNVPNSCLMTIDEKLEELIKRKSCMGEYDDLLARVCLEMEEEEKIRIDLDVATGSTINQGFGETSHQSLLSQLLSTCNDSSKLSSVSPRESEQNVTNRAPLLSKMLSESSQQHVPISSNHYSANNFGRKRRATPSEIHRNNSSTYLSHLIVDITSPSELKRLLSVLIDHGFSRFQHVDSLQNYANQTGTANGVNFDDILSKRSSVDYFGKDDEERNWDQPTRSNEEKQSHEIDVLKEISSRVEKVDVEVKCEPISNVESDEYECNEEDDEVTIEMDMEMLAAEVHRKSLALFDKKDDESAVSPVKKAKSAGNGEANLIPCELCSSVIKLSTGGSKWNLYEHVMLKHSTFKAYKCQLCSYEAGRKMRIRQHASSQHNAEVEPIDMTTPEIRKQWLDTMSKCFPQHQYAKNTIISKMQ